jgi:hypothetical protein
MAAYLIVFQDKDSLLAEERTLDFSEEDEGIRTVGRIDNRHQFMSPLAVTEGFEPSVRLYTVQRFSKPPPSATRPRHQQGKGR